MAQDINWFPGHMRKALNDMEDADMLSLIMDNVGREWML